MSINRTQIKNVFEAILEYGHDEDFVPHEGDSFSFDASEMNFDDFAAG